MSEKVTTLFKRNKTRSKLAVQDEIISILDEAKDRIADDTGVDLLVVIDEIARVKRLFGGA
ncbi:hypothetical protein [Parasulfitobacter algicola]|uniref:Uncharacterized protein n=1 Tax=Parasulfitobacter algicola TaxID=2614809 RepID=A0ABX2IR85_9RHOB|nr:hypothetical protein [Sulfitobacter algicola]NSX55411.1 hypothetical protein [Sulfitobacter algicola]